MTASPEEMLDEDEGNVAESYSKFQRSIKMKGLECVCLLLEGRVFTSVMGASKSSLCERTRNRPLLRCNRKIEQGKRRCSSGLPTDNRRCRQAARHNANATVQNNTIPKQQQHHVGYPDQVDKPCHLRHSLGQHSPSGPSVLSSQCEG
jgi:hypothetical protein